jgi:tetratricopeptide (TPR) repeat protein
MTPSLTLAMIVRNEAESLPRCLDSVAGLVDEVVICDTGSTDATLDIARRRASRLIEHPWDEDFAAARNVALEAATGDWILVLDADEVLHAGDGRALRRALEPPEALAYEVTVVNHLGEGRLGRMRAMRLFRRHADIRFRGRVHEQVAHDVAALCDASPSWSVQVLEGAVIEHDGYRPEVVARRGKAERNVRLLRRALEESPRDAYLHYKLSKELGSSARAREHLEQSAEILLALEPRDLRREALAAEILTVAALAWSESGRPAAALHAAGVAQQAFADHPATRLAIALALHACGRPREAVEEAEAALALEPAAGAFYHDAAALDLKARLLIAEALGRLGDVRRAGEVLEETLQRHPGSDHAALARVGGLLHAGNPARALEAGLQWLREHPQDARFLLLCADAAEGLGHADMARRWRDTVASVG